MTKGFRYIVVSLIAVVIVVGVGVAAYMLLSRGQVHYDNVNSVNTASGLSLVLPSQLPSDSSVIHHPAYEQSTGLITTSILVQGQSITFSQQKRPETDLKQVDAADTFLVDIGSVYILKGEEGRLQAIVETSDSWLMVNTDAKLSVKIFREVLESLDTI